MCNGHGHLGSGQAQSNSFWKSQGMGREGIHGRVGGVNSPMGMMKEFPVPGRILTPQGHHLHSRRYLRDLGKPVLLEDIVSRSILCFHLVYLLS